MNALSVISNHTASRLVRSRKRSELAIGSFHCSTGKSSSTSSIIIRPMTHIEDEFEFRYSWGGVSDAHTLDGYFVHDRRTGRSNQLLDCLTTLYETYHTFFVLENGLKKCQTPPVTLAIDTRHERGHPPNESAFLFWNDVLDSDIEVKHLSIGWVCDGFSRFYSSTSFPWVQNYVSIVNTSEGIF